MPGAVAICVTIRDPNGVSLARYSLEEAFVRLGLPWRIVEGEPTPGSVVYGPPPPAWKGATFAYDRRCYDPGQRFATVGSRPLWAPEGTPPPDVDLIGGLGRLLTLADETQVDGRARNACGIFDVNALPAARRRVSAEPLVEHHTAALARQLQMLVPGLPPARPLWPEGYRYAVCITHDADAVALAAPAEIVFNGAKALLRRKALWARMAWEGLTHRGADHDPLFGFGTWAETECAAGLRSGFFVYGRGRVRPSIHDSRSTVFSKRTNWHLLRSLADKGWEFGLHPPIRARYDLDEFLWGKEALESRLGRPVYGLRHHYWALDWRAPHLTFRKHVNAGFRYDASIAWREEGGFRAGTCLPYRPFDPGRARALDMYELPTALSDGHIMDGGGDLETALARALPIVENVRRVGGMLVLDWHAEAAIDDYCYRNLRTALVRIIADLKANSDAWFVTPWELARYWHARRQDIDIGGASP